MQRTLFVVIALLITHGTLYAADLPTAPILRIEAGAHTDSIKSIATDAGGRFAATVSDDKTARLYDVATGSLIRIFRPPIGEGREGELKAVALSPDGTSLAVGGWTKLGSLSGHTIYIFDTSSGRLVRSIGGLPNVIERLAFSADGSSLAASLLGKNGVRIFRSSTGREIGRDTEYGAASYSVHFASDGRVVTSCWDGYIRLYDRVNGTPPLKLITKTRAPGGSQPYDVRFSPDGSRIAVGYSDSTKVDLLKSGDLSLLVSADTGGVGKGKNLGRVAWSADGRTLFAGGSAFKTFNGVSEKFVRRWGNEGEGTGEDFSVGVTNTITGFASLPDGGIVIGAADPAIAMLKPSGRYQRLARPPIADYRNNRDGFQVAGDGSAIRFSYESGGKNPYRFTLSGRQLSPVEKGGTGGAFQAPISALPGIAIEGWQNTKAPKLNGIPLKLNQSESSRSVAIAPDGSRFLLGTSFRLRCFSRSGEQLWEKPVTGTWGVNIAPNGLVAVAANDDGTIRWHRLSDGKELLAFFPHADKKRWVLWTPEGFFDHSPGGEELIGFHLNRGNDREAEFIAVGKFYNQFYRPDLIDAAFEGKDLAMHAKSIDINKLLSADTLPPTVRLLTTSGPATGHDTAIKAELCDNGGGIGDITLYLNGMPVTVSKGGRGLKAVSKAAAACSIFEHTITLADGTNEISLMAYNKNMTIESNRDVIKLSYASGNKARPDLHILTVAVNNYRDGDLKLSYSVPDAQAIAESFKGKGGKLFGRIVVHQLLDAQVTKAGMEKAFADIGTLTNRDDVFVLFVAGHGITGTKDGAYYFIPYDFRYTGEGSVEKFGVSMNDFKGYLANVKALKSIILLDTCNSGSFTEALASRGMVEKTAINKLSRAVGRATIVASSKSQVALEGFEGHGAFTWTLLDGLKGNAADRSGKITINGLATYVEELLPQITHKKWGFEQVPQKNLQGMDFAIGIR